MRVTSEHWSVFLEMAEKNPALITNKFNGVQGKAQGNATWQSVADKLNSLGYGQKSIIEWRKAVTDWKSKVKIKASKIRCAQTQTGGGGIICTPLSSLEEKLLNLMGKKALEGDAEVAELGQSKSLEIVSASSSENVIMDGSFLINEENIEFFENTDHSYLATPNIGSNNKNMSKQAEKENIQPAKKRRKINCVAGISKNLQEMSQQTINILERIDKNLERVADSMQELISVLKGRT